MTEEPLTAARILEAAEDVLRRYGPAKATVVDVARALGVSHGSVYRHFPSKAALREAVVRGWLVHHHAPLAEVVAAPGPAPMRLQRWLETLFTLKRAKALDDPEMFATHLVLVRETGHVIDEHVLTLTGQLAAIITDGVARGEFGVADPLAAAGAVFDATDRFHNPVHAAEWSDPTIETAFDNVCSLVLAGLR